MKYRRDIYLNLFASLLMMLCARMHYSNGDISMIIFSLTLSLINFLGARHFYLLEKNHD